MNTPSDLRKPSPNRDSDVVANPAANSSNKCPTCVFSAYPQVNATVNEVVLGSSVSQTQLIRSYDPVQNLPKQIRYLRKRCVSAGKRNQTRGSFRLLRPRTAQKKTPAFAGAFRVTKTRSCGPLVPSDSISVSTFEAMSTSPKKVDI